MSAAFAQKEAPVNTTPDAWSSSVTKHRLRGGDASFIVLCGIRGRPLALPRMGI